MLVRYANVSFAYSRQSFPLHVIIYKKPRRWLLRLAPKNCCHVLLYVCMYVCMRACTSVQVLVCTLRLLFRWLAACLAGCLSFHHLSAAAVVLGVAVVRAGARGAVVDVAAGGAAAELAGARARGAAEALGPRAELELAVVARGLLGEVDGHGAERGVDGLEGQPLGRHRSAALGSHVGVVREQVLKKGWRKKRTEIRRRRSAIDRTTMCG